LAFLEAASAKGIIYQEKPTLKTARGGNIDCGFALVCLQGAYCNADYLEKLGLV
jgi:hypothetical protein